MKPRIFTTAFLHILLACSIFFTACDGNSPTRPQQVHTIWEVSNGLLDNDSLYFLAHYKLLSPGRVFIPLFIQTPARIHYNQLGVFQANISPDGQAESVEQIESIIFSGPQPQLNIHYTTIDITDGKIVFTYQAGWDPKKESFTYAQLSYAPAIMPSTAGLNNNQIQEIPFVDVWSFVGCIPATEWGFPSPLSYTSTDTTSLVNIITGSDYDRRLVFAASQQLDERNDYETLIQCAGILLDQLAEKIRSGREGSLQERRLIDICMTQTLLQNNVPAAMQIELPDQIHQAAYYGKSAELRRLLESGIDCNTPDSLGLSPVIYAIVGQQAACVQLLAQAGADLKLPSHSGSIPWFFASNSPLRRLFLHLNE